MPRINPHHPAGGALPPGLTGASVAQARLHAWSVAAWRLGLEQVRKTDAEAASRLDRAIGNGVAHVTAVIDVQLGTASFVVNPVDGDPFQLFTLVPGPGAGDPHV